MINKVEAYKEAIRLSYKDSLYHVAREICSYPDINTRTHARIVTSLEDDSLRKLICVPRGTLKSSLCTIAYPVWLLLNNPNIRILIDTEIYSNSITYLREIKNVMSSEKFITLFGDLRSNNWNEGEITVSNRTKTFKEASITCGAIGTTKVGQHYDCLHPDTKLFTSNGWVKAKDIKQRMRVYTSGGKFESIEKTISKVSSKDMIGIRPKYQAEKSYVTMDHRVLVFRDHAKQWIEAKDLTLQDKLLIPKIKGKTRQISKTNPLMNKLISNPDIWRLIGYWLAEGCHTPDGNQIRLCFNKDEISYLEDIKEIVETHLQVPCSIGNPTKSNTRLILFSHKEMKELLSKFGSRASNKHIPAFALNAPLINQTELINGYFRGDGNESGDVVNFTSISHSLLSGLQLILTRFNVASSLTKLRDSDFKYVAKNTKPSFIQKAYSLSSTHNELKTILGLQTKLKFKPIRSSFLDDYWVVPIQEIERKSYYGPVYDFQVKNTHDFYCPGFIAHNCIIADDYSSNRNCGSPEQRQKVIDHFKYNLSILEPDGTVVIVGTRYHEDDIIGFIIKKILGFTNETVMRQNLVKQKGVYYYD